MNKKISISMVVLLIAALACSLPGWTRSSAPSASEAEETRNGPSVMIQTPMPGAHVTVGESFDFLASARDESGVVRLDLWIDGAAVLSQASPDANGLTTLSLMYPLVATQSGTYALIVHAYNSQGELRDSAIHYVTAVEASASTQEYSRYIVQAGDTLESIAQKLGVGVDDLLKVNPSIKNGQVAPGQVVLIPIGVQPPVQAAVPAPGGGAQPLGQPVNPPGGQAGGGQPGNPPGGQPAGNPPGGQPGILPVFNPGPVILPPLPPGVVQLNPNLFPIAGNVINVPGGAPNAPSDAQASVNGCQVTLVWKDNASNETMYRVWRTDAGAPSSHIVGRLQTDDTQFTDTLKRAGKYMYEIEYYYRELEADQKTIKKEVVERSAPLWVDVPAAANCPQGSSRRVMFQPLSFQPSDASLRYGFLNITIGGFTAVRVPRGQQNSYTTGRWSWGNDIDRWAIPMPELANMKPGDSLRVEFQGNAMTDSNSQLIILVGTAAVSHTFETLTAADAKDRVWEARGDQMTVTYKIWLEDWQWDGSMASGGLPVPYDLQMQDLNSSKGLTWKVNASSPPNHDGFIVYSSYQCAGSSEPKKTIRVVDSELDVIRKSDEPLGCACSYQVSSFGVQGESKLSSPTTQACRTIQPEESVSVTFESLNIKNLSQPMSAAISIFANEEKRTSGNTLFPSAGIYPLQPILLNGSKVTVNFAPGGSRAIQLGFSVANLCQGQFALGADVKSWKGVSPQQVLLTSADGNCEVIVTISETQPQALPPPATTQVQLPILKSMTMFNAAEFKYGAIVVGDDEQDRMVQTFLIFDLSVIPLDNSGLVDATLHLGSCNNNGIPPAVQPFHLLATGGPWPIGDIPKGECEMDFDVTGMIHQVLGTFHTFEILIRPDEISADGNEDSIEFRNITLTVTYHP